MLDTNGAASRRGIGGHGGRNLGDSKLNRLGTKTPDGAAGAGEDARGKEKGFVVLDSPSAPRGFKATVGGDNVLFPKGEEAFSRDRRMGSDPPVVPCRNSTLGGSCVPCRVRCVAIAGAGHCYPSIQHVTNPASSVIRGPPPSNPVPQSATAAPRTPAT